MSPELSRALSVLGAAAPDGAAAAHEAASDEMAAFSNRAADTRFGMQLDWKLTNAAVLDELLVRFESEVPIDLSFDGDDCEIAVEDEQGDEQVARLPNVDSLRREEVVSTFLKLMPGAPAAFKLKYFETSDSDEYLILDEKTTSDLLTALGTRAGDAVRRVG